MKWSKIRSTRTFSPQREHGIHASGSAPLVSIDLPQVGQVCIVVLCPESTASSVTQHCQKASSYQDRKSRLQFQDNNVNRLASDASTTARLVVPKHDSRLRLDLFLARQLTGYSRSRIQQLIRSKFVMLNGEPARSSDLVRAGDLGDLTEPPPEKIDNQPQAIALNIIFEDDDLIVINKPPGLVVHPGAGHRECTLVNALLYHFPTLSGIGGKERPGIVHRLDKDTSGCLVVAKNDQAHRGLSKQFAARSVEKIYLALVAGKLRKAAGVIEEKIG